MKDGLLAIDALPLAEHAMATESGAGVRAPGVTGIVFKFQL
jgi:hypothetical protein